VRYLVWAESLSQGKGFIDETVPEPTRYVLHAPLYSVLLAPSQLFVNLSVVSAKVLTLLLAAVALFLFYVWLRKELGEVFAKVGLILITINPITLAYSTEILSELPFVLILMSMFLTLLNLSAETNDKKNFWILIFLLSLAGLLRETGVAVVLSIAFYLLLKKQYKKSLISFLVPV
jgi:4-amino-4-deoxy-L-arabinose transferase-like glycosyltransferase